MEHMMQGSCVMKSTYDVKRYAGVSVVGGGDSGGEGSSEDWPAATLRTTLRQTWRNGWCCDLRESWSVQECSCFVGGVCVYS